MPFKKGPAKAHASASLPPPAPLPQPDPCTGPRWPPGRPAAALAHGARLLDWHDVLSCSLFASSWSRQDAWQERGQRSGTGGKVVDTMVDKTLTILADDVDGYLGSTKAYLEVGEPLPLVLAPVCSLR